MFLCTFLLVVISSHFVFSSSHDVGAKDDGQLPEGVATSLVIRSGQNLVHVNLVLHIS